MERVALLNAGGGELDTAALGVAIGVDIRIGHAELISRKLDLAALAGTNIDVGVGNIQALGG